MTKFKGTPEKWIVNEHNNVVSKHNLPIAIVYDGFTPHGSYKNESEECRKANAKVIAAAPELLETLIEVVRISDRNHDAWNKAKEAIKKAIE